MCPVVFHAWLGEYLNSSVILRLERLLQRADESDRQPSSGRALVSQWRERTDIPPSAKVEDSYVRDNAWLWGILDVIVGLAAIYAGYDILRGGTFGRIVGVVIAGISAVRWWFYLPAVPYLGIVMIPIAIVIIYGLVVHGEFFDASQRDSGEPV